jgi:N utilization substance protein A
VFATHALSPAKISRVSIVDAADRHMEVIVDDTQLSLAIGKKGQNVRLAAKLLGWKIDIKSEEEKRQEVESQMAALVAPGAPISVLLDYGLPENIVETLLTGGVTTVERLGNMTPEDLEAIPGIGPDLVENIRDVVVSYYGQYDDAAEVVQDEASQEQQPTLEIGEEGYNGNEPIADVDTVETVAGDEDSGVAPTSEIDSSDEQGTDVAEDPSEADQDESAKLKNAE